jgi:putative ABC transport system ATP-binding protein
MEDPRFGRSVTRAVELMIEIHDLLFRYPNSDFEIRVPSLSVATGERLAIIGPSGCGKTTLLNLLCALARPDQGQVSVDSTALQDLTSAQARKFRASHIGYVFQDFGLLDYLSARDNILYPYRISAGRQVDAAVKERAEALASDLGVQHRMRHRPGSLSQGERQRVAICRAMLTQPALILADEPTGNLDPATKHRIMDVLLSSQKSLGATLITVTHDHDLLSSFDRVVDFNDFAEQVS